MERPRTNMAPHGPPATTPSQAPAGEDRTANGPTHRRKGPRRGHARCTAGELVSGTGGVVPWGHHTQPSVKVHPDKNTHHREKAEGLFKQIAKANNGLLHAEAQRRNDANIQRGDRRQQREVR